MLLINTTYEIITPESAEDGDVAENGFLSENEPVTFRELVERLTAGEPSCSPCDGDTRTWVTHYGSQNPADGSYENESVHFANTNPARKAKYWARALALAGH